MYHVRRTCPTQSNLTAFVSSVYTRARSPDLRKTTPHCVPWRTLMQTMHSQVHADMSLAECNCDDSALIKRRPNGDCNSSLRRHRDIFMYSSTVMSFPPGPLDRLVPARASPTHRLLSNLSQHRRAYRQVTFFDEKETQMFAKWTTFQTGGVLTYF